MGKQHYAHTAIGSLLGTSSTTHVRTAACIRRYGSVFSLVPAPLSNETGSYPFIAILAAIIYSIVIRREPALPTQEKILTLSLQQADSGPSRTLPKS